MGQYKLSLCMQGLISGGNKLLKTDIRGICQFKISLPSSFNGKDTIKVASSFSVLTALINPSCLSIICLHMARPIPLPSYFV